MPESRQRKYQLKMQRQNRCVQCGAKVPCLRCLAKKAAIQRKRNDYKPWKPGGKGRIPIWFRMGGSNQQSIT